ncbi:MAG: DegT/DnrJ/EryC1/StrS family aminotransferase [Candidatus Zixiibacteriota bacterium]
MAVPLLDLSRQYAYLKPEMNKAVLEVIESSAFILGPKVKELEDQIADLSDTKYAVGTASGTDALLIALRACDVGPGDEVITTDFSFFASAGVISRLGARPVFVDIEADTYNIDPNLIAAAVTPKTKVIMPVHLFGQVADMDPIMAIAREHHLKVVEDAAQAIGAEYKGRRAGSIGDFGCFSFYPSKNLGAGGDGGMIVTNNEVGAARCRMLRVHGESPKYFYHMIGYNSRLDSLQAAILLVKLPHLEGWSKKRLIHAGIYDKALAGLSGLTLPVRKDYSTFHIYNQYTIASPEREKLIAAFKGKNIGHCIYYPLPFHKQECFADLGYKADDFPVSNRAADEVVSIPIYPELTADEQAEVIEVIKGIVS